MRKATPRRTSTSRLVVHAPSYSHSTITTKVPTAQSYSSTISILVSHLSAHPGRQGLQLSSWGYEPVAVWLRSGRIRAIRLGKKRTISHHPQRDRSHHCVCHAIMTYKKGAKHQVSGQERIVINGLSDATIQHDAETPVIQQLPRRSHQHLVSPSSIASIFVNHRDAVERLHRALHCRSESWYQYATRLPTTTVFTPSSLPWSWTTPSQASSVGFATLADVSAQTNSPPCEVDLSEAKAITAHLREHHFQHVTKTSANLRNAVKGAIAELASLRKEVFITQQRLFDAVLIGVHTAGAIEFIKTNWVSKRSRIMKAAWLLKTSKNMGCGDLCPNTVANFIGLSFHQHRPSVSGMWWALTARQRL